MYEETRSSIDWKGLFLKVIIAFLIVLIGFKVYSTLKGNNDQTKTTETIANSKTSSTFTANIEKLKEAGESYFTNNSDKLPNAEGSTSMVTLNELISAGEIKRLSDENGKNCDGESSYVTAIKEGEKVKIKANLVCGDASSYSLVYMGQNDKEESKSTSSNGSTATYSSKTSNSKSGSTTCGSSCSTPAVTANASSKSTVIINGGNNKKSTSNKKTTAKKNTNKKTTNKKSNKSSKRVYTTDTVTVSFDSNGGNRDYSSQRVEIGDTAYYPGSTSKSGYTFKGWYLNNTKYDFSTPVERNITLVAKYTKNSYYYDDDDDYYDDDDDYYYDTTITKTATTNVYTMGWDSYNANKVTVSHTLALPDLGVNFRKIRIKNISYVKAINTTSLANTYESKHASTFLYSPNGWESDIKSNSMATVSGAKFSFNSNYKDVYTATTEGFDVTWISTGISRRCTSFTVYGPDGQADNICNYGIVYKVTWEYVK